MVRRVGSLRAEKVASRLAEYLTIRLCIHGMTWHVKENADFFGEEWFSEGFIFSMTYVGCPQEIRTRLIGSEDWGTDLERKSVSRTLSLAKAIANMTLRQDVSGSRRIVFNFFSKLVDKDAQIFAFVTILRSPNRG
jgi:hypothetical protein